MKISYLLFAVLVFMLPVAAQQDSPRIKTFRRENKDFGTGGHPRLEHFEQLKAEGVKAVINLRQPSEHRAAEEEAKVKELGLRYFNIPFSVTDPKDEPVDEFLKVTDDPENRPAFIHCTAAIRVGAFWLIRRVLRDGWKVEDAEAEAVKIGLRESPHWLEFARKYIETHKSKASLPVNPMSFGAFTARFDPAGTFTIEGDRWPKINGTWKDLGSEVEILMSGGPDGCAGPGKYRYETDGKHLSFNLVSDDCKPRQMILDRSTWRPSDEVVAKHAREIVSTGNGKPPARPMAGEKGSWPSFRGPHASGIAEGQNLPDQWNGKTGDNILWRSEER